MTLNKFLDKLDKALKENPATHPAKVCFDLARETGASVFFAGLEGEPLDQTDFQRWWKAGGPDPFVDGEGRATIRIKTSHRINDWVVINARLKHDGLFVDKRHHMLRSWVVE